MLRGADLRPGCSPIPEQRLLGKPVRHRRWAAFERSRRRTHRRRSFRGQQAQPEHSARPLSVGGATQQRRASRWRRPPDIWPSRPQRRRRLRWACAHRRKPCTVAQRPRAAAGAGALSPWSFARARGRKHRSSCCCSGIRWARGRRQRRCIACRRRQRRHEHPERRSRAPGVDIAGRALCGDRVQWDRRGPRNVVGHGARLYLEESRR
mmetsp:Transcript_121439/g.348954  ORF Transcript_121439/g.348954 Transcript_121439/m.348954 type:complete len:208 (-) Transcript_121439:244-867(-)